MPVGCGSSGAGARAADPRKGTVMRVVLACIAACAGALALTVGPLSQRNVAVAVAVAASPAVVPVTSITIHGSGGDQVYSGVGAILGGGGNARYLMDYPTAQRNQILDYLFKPGYGATLQILKLDIGGDADSSDGSEPSVEHSPG